MHKHQYLFGTRGIGASMCRLVLALMMPTALSAMPFACLSRGGVASTRYPYLLACCMNWIDWYDSSESTRMNLSMSLPVLLHSGWESKSAPERRHSSSAPLSLVMIA
jgi:hypothetical protein